MATFFMFGKYSMDAMKDISAERTEQATALIQKYGGEFKSGYVLLGEYDLVLIVEFPDTAQAIKTSVALTKLTGISFATAPAVTVEDFDTLIQEV